MHKDTALWQAISLEQQRQKNNIELIASENFVSQEVLDATGSVLTNKYAEGYPGKRYYGGCVDVDLVENLARDRAKQLFHAEHVNVQPHSGSQANMGVYMSILSPKDKVLGMDLAAGGHLTHGASVSFSGQLYDFVHYGVDQQTETLNYEEILEIAKRERPKLIVAGASAYPRHIDFAKFRKIADEVGAYLMVDMAHIAGIVAAGRHMNPVEYADFVTTTTHKTLRGPRGGMIFCKQEYAQKLDKAIFPGIQGGPLCHVVAGKAVCFYEALQPEFHDYIDQVLKNNQVLVETLQKQGFRIVTGGSDNHLLLVDVKGSIGMTGKEAEHILDEIHITCNKNAIPFDTESPFKTSGIRLGSAAMTTKGFKEKEFEHIGLWISQALKKERSLEQLKEEVLVLTKQFPFYDL